jgi:hypothetical protein
MNWARIWTGAAIAALVLWAFDLGFLILTQRVLVSEPNLMWGEVGPIALSLALPSLVLGFLLCWLYVLARPRLGPGPQTALVIGSIGCAFANPHFFTPTIFIMSFTGAVIQIAMAWVKFAVATYLAGWQYIERAP